MKVSDLISEVIDFFQNQPEVNDLRTKFFQRDVKHVLEKNSDLF